MSVLTDSIIPSLKAKTEVQDSGWRNISLANGISSGDPAPQCRKLTFPGGGLSVVYLRGGIRNITAQGVVAYLPSGFAPTTSLSMCATLSSGGQALQKTASYRLIISSNGSLQYATEGAVGNPVPSADYYINCSFLLN